jgi:hypothetical protein
MYIPAQWRLEGAGMDLLHIRGAVSGGGVQQGNTNRSTTIFRLPAAAMKFPMGTAAHTLFGEAAGHTTNENDEVIRLIIQPQPDGTGIAYFESTGISLSTSEVITFDTTMAL